MESKKLQQLQQANSHLAPQKKVPLSYQTNIADYRTSAHSPVFQNHHLQYHGGGHQPMYQHQQPQQQQQSPSSSGSQLTPIDVQPQGKLMLKTTAYHQQQFTGEQIYQTPPDRGYQMSAAAGRPSLYQAAGSQHQHHPVTALQQQYQQLQQAKIQAQIQTQNEALVQQQRTFAMRQQLNPPVPQGHYHMSQSSSMMSSPQQQQSPHHQSAATSSHRTVPPSTLNLSSQFQPAPGPLKVAPNTKHFHQDQASIYAQQQHQLQLQLQLQQQQLQQQQQKQQLQQQQQQHHQLLSGQLPQDNAQQRQKVAPPLKTDLSGITPGSEPSPVYIQQNHPGHVVNQACQTQISGALGNKTPAKTPSSEDSSNKSPSGTSTSATHSQLDRKKSSGSIQALKSPITKRPPTSPVAMSGWLYKQGSDGLKVWRKRWFVLAEYCLYYYKGPEEEKLLGSILLPSYKVSACLPEDKIYRKYAFKCEHTNMRTYWLAAETAEAMIQWVRALTAATMMQASSESDQMSQPSVSSLNQSADNSDSGIHTLQSQQSKMSLSQGPVTPASDNGAQPLYANAPPKPRRINDGGYSSPSPEHSVDNEGSVGRKHSHSQQARRSGAVMSPSLQQMQRSQHHAIYDSRTGNVTSALRMQSSADNLANQFQQMAIDANRQSPYHANEYGTKPGGSVPQTIPGTGYNHPGVDLEEQLMRMPSRSVGDDIYGERELYMQKIIQQRYPPTQTVMGYASAERRTPDAYGRSKNRPFSDYEDIYNLTQCKSPQPQEVVATATGYRRPMSPPTYDTTKHVPPMPSRYTPNHLEATGSSTNLRTRPSTASIIRPHSADFLEYEARAESAAAAAASSSGAIKPDAIRAPRPKSSLDINRAPDSFYYSEASYAEKMRQSALYLQSPQTAQPQQQQQPPPPAPASAYGRHQEYTTGYPGSSGMHTIGYENPYERTHKRNELLQEATLNQGTSSVPRMSRGVSNSAISKDIISNSTQLRSQQPQHHHQSSQQQLNQHEQFLRSASARLPRRDEDAPSTPTTSLQDGERKREESMKRLLEWKQRMLQSPLTRKGMQQSGSATLMTKLGSNPNILTAGASNTLGQHSTTAIVTPQNTNALGLASAVVGGGGGSGAVVVGGVSGIQRSRSETHANTGGYNSYSSDDEDGPKKSPAGRSTTTTPTPPSSSIYAIETNKSAIDISPIQKNNATHIMKPLNSPNSTSVQSHANNTNSPKPILKSPSHSLSKIDASPSVSQVAILSEPPSLPKRNSPAVKKDLSSSLLDDYSVSSYVPVYKPKILEATASTSKNYENVTITTTDEDTEEPAEESEEPTTDVTPEPAENPTEDEDVSESDEEDIDDRTCEYTDDDLDEALADSETAPTPTGPKDDDDDKLSLSSLPIDDPEQFYENDPPTLLAQPEDHYLPMTPKRSVMSPSASLVFASLNDATADDENPYVEMTKGLEDNSNSNYEVVCVASLSTARTISESIPLIIPEPVYMELSQGKAPPEEILSSGKSTLKKSALKKSTETLKKSSDTLKKKSKKSSERSQNKRKDLPDILKPSQSTIMSSDSSDADDESSKNVDNIKMRSRSRFSLSDTFRPASYYLGATTPLANCAESSDSEIVSPPPIPLSPPPMEELNTEEIFSSENYDTVKRKDKFNLSYDQIPKIHSSNSSLNINKPEAGLKSSRLSLPDQFSKMRGLKTPILKSHERTLSDSNYSIQTDNSSNTSSDFDLYNKLKNSSPSFVSSPRYQSNSSLPQKLTTGDSSETDSVEYRHRQGSDSELDRQRSRRPLSEESISEIESMSEQFEETLTTTDLDSYLSQLQTTNDLYIYQNSETNLLNDAAAAAGVGVMGGIIGNLIKPPEIFRNKGDEHFYGNINFVSSTDSLQKVGSEKDHPQQSLLKEKNLSLHDAQCASDDVLMSSAMAAISGSALTTDTAKSVTLSSVDLDQTSFCTAFDLTQATPIHSRNNSNISEQSAPYYYSELSSSRELASPIPLNNQRDITVGQHRSATGISHIHNPISKPVNPVIDNLSFKGAVRSLSVEILTEKDQTIDSKNLYKMKTNIEKLSYCTNKNLKMSGDPSTGTVDHFQHHRQSSLTFASTSNTSSPLPEAKLSKHLNIEPSGTTEQNNPVKLSGFSGAGEQFWEEDALWRESLRRVSQRHARSMDELDRIQPGLSEPKQPKVKISRDVTYVNDNVSGRSSYKSRLSDPIHEGSRTDSDEKNENDVYVQLAAAMDDANSDVYEVLREDSGGSSYSRSVEIDRETIRQWDSMSSGLMKNSSNNNNPTSGSSNGENSTLKGDSNGNGLGGGSSTEQSPSMTNETASTETDCTNVTANETTTFTKLYTSISVRNVRNIPKVNLTVKPDPSDPMLSYDQIAKYYGTSLDAKYAKTTQLATERDRNLYGMTGATTPIASGLVMDVNGSNYDINAASAYRDSNGYHPMRRIGSRAEIDLLERETSTQMRNLDVSAGDLLSRTHEELVLLLIQLRRQNSNTARAIEQCCTDIHEIQNRIRTAEGLTRAESIQRLDYLKQHLLDLERQYEKSKPLVNLVDNMVKLGSLYRSNDTTGRLNGVQRPESVTLDRLEFNQRVQERRMLQEEQKQWDRLSPNHTELQSKVRQLYQLDQLLQEESGTLQNLQRDKEDLERALGGLRARIHDSNGTPMALEAAKKQQHMLERELSRVHQLLAENSKKLEQTVAGNARLEQELLVLRQKLQASRGSQNALNPLRSESMQYASSTTALLESELKRVQQLVGDMQRQRQELSQAVRQLTENSNRLYQEIGNKENSSTPLSSHIKKRTSSTCWIETDLDSMVSVDRTVNDTPNLSTPLYVDTSSANSSVNVLNFSASSKLSEFDDSSKNNRSYRYHDSDPLETSGVDSDGFLDTNPFANLSNQEKQEIKTVRIVKRESERRHRDRERSTNNSTQNLDQVLEEENHSAFITEDYQSRSKSLPRTYTEPPKPMPKVHKNHSGSRQSIKYTDYYSTPPSTTNNPYMVSMSDRNCNVYPFHQQQSSLPNGYHSKTGHYHQQQPPPPAPSSMTQSALRHKTESMQSLTKSITDLSTVFQSEAARQIINEMSAGSASEDNTTTTNNTSTTEKVPSSHKHRRAVPREKRRHYTAPNNVNAKAMENIQAENDMNRNNTNWRARDDLDMEVALRPRINAPDVVRSALAHGEKISENTIDNLLSAPNKIVIPERYIPEKTPELSPEEKKRRQEKVEVIKKMLSEAPINSSNDTVSLPPSKINAEKKQREHLLQLNQILAQQVMQMSKIVAEKAMAARPSKIPERNTISTPEEDRSSSPTDSLPIYQQRDNFFT